MSLGGNTTIVNREEKIAGVRLQTSAYGVPIPIYYGVNRAVPNIVWYGDFQAIEHKSTSSAGGKGGGGVETVSISYTYKVALILALGEGDITVTTVQPNKDGWQAPAALGLEAKTGTDGQAVWGHLTANHPTEAIGYSGTAYLAASAYDLGNSASLPNYSVMLDGGLPALGDAIADFLTHSRYGANFPIARLSGLSTMDAYLDGEGVAFSPFATAQKPAADYLREWTDMANTAMVWSEGLLKFIVRDNGAAVAYDLGPDDFEAEGDDLPVRVTRKPNADAYNQLQVEYLDSDHDHNAATVTVDDLANIDAYGPRPASGETYHAAKDAATAQWIAQHRLQRKLYVRTEYRFKLSWRHGRLEPMDIVTLTEPNLHLDHEPVRITEIEEDEFGFLDLTAEEYNGQIVGVASYPTQAPAGPAVNTGVAPGNANTPVIFEPPVSLAGSNQLWLATSGGADWGGCEVWASLDNISYSRVGIFTGKSRHGTLRATLPSGSATDTTNLCKPHLVHGELPAGTTQDATDLLTLCYVDGEYLAYRDSTLVAAGDYDLGYLVRGAYGSSIASHASGTQFARLDESLFKMPLTDLWTGRTIYIKLLSFNVWGGALQGLADVSPSTYTVSGLPAAAPAGLSATAFQTNINLTWTAIGEPANYASIEVLRNTSNDSGTATVVAVLPTTSAQWTDPVGVSSATRYYWIRLVGFNGATGALSGVVSAVTGTVGGIYVSGTTPGSTYLGQDVVYSTTDESLYEWTGSAYVKSAPVVNATQINAANLAAISADLGSITAGSLNIAGKFIVETSGTFKLTGTTTSFIQGGQTDYNTGTGWFLGYSGGAYKFSIGNPAGNRLTWDGTTLTVSGTLSTDYANITGTKPPSSADNTNSAISAGTTISGGGITLSSGGAIASSGKSYGGATAGFWLGYTGGAYKLDIGNSSSYIRWDGSTLSVGGSIIATGNIVSDAISKVNSSYAESSTSFSNGDTIVSAASHASGSGNPTVVIDFCVMPAANTTQTLKLYRDSTVIATFSFTSIYPGGPFAFTVSDAPGDTSAHTYALKQESGGSRSFTNRSIVVATHKR